MQNKLKIRKGDNVMVISGESKGQQGRVLLVDPENERAIVEGINMVSKHQRPNAENPKGGIVKKEAPVYISNLMLIDASGKPTRVGRRISEKTGKLVRFSKKTGEEMK